MPNIRVIPLSWWSVSASAGVDTGMSLDAGITGLDGAERPPQVVTCVKLKYVQQPVGRRARLGKGVIRPSKRIVYDANEAVVCFLSEKVEGCVDEFLEEWASVSKIVVIAREGASFFRLFFNAAVDIHMFSRSFSTPLVAEMAKEKRWEDVRILSFDLQTIEFAYASVSP